MSAARNFSISKLRLRRIYESEVLQGFSNGPFQASAELPGNSLSSGNPASPAGNTGPVDKAADACGKIDKVYGPFRFPDMPADRSYSFGSFVMSVDGRIAYAESPDGTLIAKTNRLDPDGGLCDYWILNLLRSVSGAVIMGSATLAREPYLTGEIFDEDLISCRAAHGLPAVPLHVAVTRAGKNLPVHHKVFTDSGIPTVIAASSDGAKRIAEDHSGRVRFLGCCRDGTELRDADILAPGGLHSLTAELSGTPLLIGFGTGSELDAGLLLAALKRGGIHKTLIESPLFLVRLMQEELLDELFLNTSGLFIGGAGLPLGMGTRAFTADNHPHTRMLSIHSHSDSFFYHRYRMDYSGMAGHTGD